MAQLNLQSADPILKTLYRQSKVEDMVYRNRPCFSAVNKFEEFKGRNMQIPIQYGHPQGRSANFTNAQNNTTAALFKDFLLTRKKDYSLASVDGETADATEGDNGAFVSALAVQIDGAMKALADSHATSIFRNGSGSIGQVLSITGNALTLAVAADVACFEVGMTLQSVATDGGTPKAGTEVLGGVNRGAGTLTSTSASWATVITTIAANDYLLVQGDSNAKMSGFDAWIPAVAPVAGDNYYAVDRSADSRLYGVLYDASQGDSMEEACINAQSVGAREGAQIDRIWLNPARFRDLVKGAQAKTQYPRQTVNARGAGGDIARIGYSGIVIDGDEGPITVLSDARCQFNTGWALTSDTWTLNSIGPATKMLMKDNLRIQRDPTSDSYSVRCGFYGNLSCNAPGWNVRIKFA